MGIIGGKALPLCSDWWRRAKRLMISAICCQPRCGLRFPRTLTKAGLNMSLLSAIRFAQTCSSLSKLPDSTASEEMSWTCSECNSSYAALGQGPFKPGSTLCISHDSISSFPTHLANFTCVLRVPSRSCTISRVDNAYRRIGLTRIFTNRSTC
jgi:hypothetical protein